MQKPKLLDQLRNAIRYGKFQGHGAYSNCIRWQKSYREPKPLSTSEKTPLKTRQKKH